MHCGESLSFKSARPRAATAVVATPLCGSRRPCSTLSCGRPSQSSHLKLTSISPRDLQRSSLPAISHISRATRDDDDAIAPPAAVMAAAEPYMPKEWPDFPKIQSAPDVRKKFFNRSKEYTMLKDYLDDEPSKPLLLLGPINSGKSVSDVIVSLSASWFLHYLTHCTPLRSLNLNTPFSILNYLGIITRDF